MGNEGLKGSDKRTTVFRKQSNHAKQGLDLPIYLKATVNLLPLH